MCRWPEEVEKQTQARRFRRCKRQGTQFGTGRRRLARWSAGCSRCRLVVHEAPVAQPLVDEFGWSRIYLTRWSPDVIVCWCVGMESELFARDGKLGNDNPLPLSSWQCCNGLGFVVGRERESG
uniref:Uncharacterized protein n=2 Tax=Oryza TaxID=4527 RepID=Q64M83_ORYSJ|nr:hypothetical protein [Oryza sativa Japonica Group]